MRAVTEKISTLITDEKIFEDRVVDAREAALLTKKVRFIRDHDDVVAYDDVRFIAAHADLVGGAKTVFESFFGPGSTNGSSKGVSLFLKAPESVTRSWETCDPRNYRYKG